MEEAVLYVAGNHEYYTQTPMNGEEETFKARLAANHPLVNLLRDEAVGIHGVNFFGGTMWTNFKSGDRRAMVTARSQINDFRLMHNPDGTVFKPVDAVALLRRPARGDHSQCAGHQPPHKVQG